MLQSNNRNNLLQKFNDFKRQVESSGKNPQQIFDEVTKSGKYTSQQIEQAKKLAMLFAGLNK